MGTQLISGAQQILMVLGDQGAREPRTMKCTKASKKKTLFIAFFLATFPYAICVNFATYCTFCVRILQHMWACVNIVHNLRFLLKNLRNRRSHRSRQIWCLPRNHTPILKISLQILDKFETFEIFRKNQKLEKSSEGFSKTEVSLKVRSFFWVKSKNSEKMRLVPQPSVISVLVKGWWHFDERFIRWSSTCQLYRVDSRFSARLEIGCQWLSPLKMGFMRWSCGRRLPMKWVCVRMSASKSYD